jgi:hypothetical protein
MPKRPSEIDLNLAIAHRLGPDWFCRDRLGFEPDEWQAKLLRSRSRQVILNMGRQVGKSIIVAALALHTALYRQGGLILVIAPSQRQSRELFIKVHGFLQRLEPPEILEEEAKLSLMLGNGSRDREGFTRYAAKSSALITHGAPLHSWRPRMMPRSRISTSHSSRGRATP